VEFAAFALGARSVCEASTSYGGSAAATFEAVLFLAAALVGRDEQVSTVQGTQVSMQLSCGATSSGWLPFHLTNGFDWMYLACGQFWMQPLYVVQVSEMKDMPAWQACPMGMAIPVCQVWIMHRGAQLRSSVGFGVIICLPAQD
jgi:hypothetical protein